jgi:hypothetical protein
MAVRNVQIPEELYLALESKLESLGMSSVDECVEFILRSLLSGEHDHEELSDDEERRMRERLADLGYM